MTHCLPGPASVSSPAWWHVSSWTLSHSKCLLPEVVFHSVSYDSNKKSGWQRGEPDFSRKLRSPFSCSHPRWEYFQIKAPREVFSPNSPPLLDWWCHCFALRLPVFALNIQIRSLKCFSVNSCGWYLTLLIVTTSGKPYCCLDGRVQRKTNAHMLTHITGTQACMKTYAHMLWDIILHFIFHLPLLLCLWKAPSISKPAISFHQAS